MTTDVTNNNNNKITGSALGDNFRRQDLATEIDLSEEMKRLGETTGKVSSAQLVGRKNIFYGIVKLFSFVEVPNT